ncbi:MAG: potassium transporter TrkG [Chlamydiota bacterium]
MRYAEIYRILGSFLFYFSALLLFPLAVAIYYEFVELPEAHPQPHSSYAFFLTLCLGVALSLVFRYLGRKATRLVFRKESILLVVATWLLSALIAALPFYFSNTLRNPLDAYFEAISGLTTTGSTLIAPKSFDEEGKEQLLTLQSPEGTALYSYYGTVDPVIDSNTGATLQGLEAVGKAVLVWRSFLQWLGGMGIIVLFLTILPALGVGGKTLYQTETTGPVYEGISPRLKDTASLLWKLYIFLSLLETVLLLLTNHSLGILDAVCITFSNLSTGGFALHAESIGYYNNAYTEAVVILFMILGSVNFALYFHIIRMQLYRLYQTDVFLFFSLILIGSLVTSLAIVGAPNENLRANSTTYSFLEALRTGVFQWISAQSSTGYFTANYDLWPLTSQILFFLAMFLGGMSGSTSGGMKTTRFYLFAKIASNRLEGLFRPETIRVIRFGKIEVQSQIAIMVLLFFCTVFFSTVIGGALFIVTGIDLDTSFGLISCFLNNVGIAFRSAGPLQQINFLSAPAKGLAIFWMLLGRLEYFAVLILFFPHFWKSK